jgi:hypothetical protein
MPTDKPQGRPASSAHTSLETLLIIALLDIGLALDQEHIETHTVGESASTLKIRAIIACSLQRSRISSATGGGVFGRRRWTDVSLT